MLQCGSVPLRRNRRGAPPETASSRRDHGQPLVCMNAPPHRPRIGDPLCAVNYSPGPVSCRALSLTSETLSATITLRYTVVFLEETLIPVGVSAVTCEGWDSVKKHVGVSPSGQPRIRGGHAQGKAPLGNGLRGAGGSVARRRSTLARPAALALRLPALACDRAGAELGHAGAARR